MPKFGAGAQVRGSGTWPGCAVLTRKLGGRPEGTAVYMTSWLLIEQPGPWAPDALEPVLAKAFGGRPIPASMRALLIRRPGKHQRTAGPRTVYVASGLPGNRWLERLEVDDLTELADLDLTGVAHGRAGHGEAVEGPLFLICTHGAKDMCCAVLGRPLAASLGESHPDRTWEVSHVGGDRWAGNLLVVPDGYLHGQVDADEAALVAKAALGGQVYAERLRGRTSARDSWAQCAEIAVRRQTGLRALDAVIALKQQNLTATSRLVTVRAGEDRYAVRVALRPRDHSEDTRCQDRLNLSEYVVDELRRI